MAQPLKHPQSESAEKLRSAVADATGRVKARQAQTVDLGVCNPGVIGNNDLVVAVLRYDFRKPCQGYNKG